MSDVPLFDLPEDTPVPAPKKTTQPATGKPAWTQYRPKDPVRCDDCMALYVEDPNAPLARHARYVRKLGGDRRLLCPAHARQWREYDGLAGPRGPKP